MARIARCDQSRHRGDGQVGLAKALGHPRNSPPLGFLNTDWWSGSANYKASWVGHDSRIERTPTQRPLVASRAGQIGRRAGYRWGSHEDMGKSASAAPGTVYGAMRIDSSVRFIAWQT